VNVVVPFFPENRRKPVRADINRSELSLSSPEDSANHLFNPEIWRVEKLLTPNKLSMGTRWLTRMKMSGMPGYGCFRVSAAAYRPPHPGRRLTHKPLHR